VHGLLHGDNYHSGSCGILASIAASKPGQMTSCTFVHGLLCGDNYHWGYCGVLSQNFGAHTWANIILHFGARRVVSSIGILYVRGDIGSVCLIISIFCVMRGGGQSSWYIYTHQQSCCSPFGSHYGHAALSQYLPYQRSIIGWLSVPGFWDHHP